MSTSEKVVSPEELFFTQESICSTFKKPRDTERIDDAVEDIVEGRLSPKAFPKMNVVEFQNRLWSLDNRRLWVFKKAEVRLVTVTIVRDDIHSGFHNIVSSFPSLYANMARQDFFPRVRGPSRENFALEPPSSPDMLSRFSERSSDSDYLTSEAPYLPYHPKKKSRQPRGNFDNFAYDNPHWSSPPHGQSRDNYARHVKCRTPPVAVDSQNPRRRPPPNAQHVPSHFSNRRRDPSPRSPTSSQNFNSESPPMPGPSRKSCRKPLTSTQEFACESRSLSRRTSARCDHSQTVLTSELPQAPFSARKIHRQARTNSQTITSETAHSPFHVQKHHDDPQPPFATLTTSKLYSPHLPPLSKKRKFALPDSSYEDDHSDAPLRPKKLKVASRDLKPSRKSQHFSLDKSSLGDGMNHLDLAGVLPTKATLAHTPSLVKKHSQSRLVSSEVKHSELTSASTKAKVPAREAKPSSDEFHTSMRKKSKAPSTATKSKSPAPATVSATSELLESDISSSFDYVNIQPVPARTIRPRSCKTSSIASKATKQSSWVVQEDSRGPSVSLFKRPCPPCLETKQSFGERLPTPSRRPPRKTLEVDSSLLQETCKMPPNKDDHTAKQDGPSSSMVNCPVKYDSKGHLLESNRPELVRSFLASSTRKSDSGAHIRISNLEERFSLVDLRAWRPSTGETGQESQFATMGQSLSNEQRIVAHSRCPSRYEETEWYQKLSGRKSGGPSYNNLQITVHGTENSVDPVNEISKTRSGINYKKGPTTGPQYNERPTPTDIVPFRATKGESQRLKSVKSGEVVFVNMEEVPIDGKGTTIGDHRSWLVMGPLKVVKMVNKFAAKLDVPSDSHLHPNFPLSKLKRSLGPLDILLPSIKPIPEIILQKRANKRVRKRVNKRVRKRKVYDYLVKWKDGAASKTSWEADKIFSDYPHLLNHADLPEFQADLPDFKNPFLLRNLNA